MVQLGRDPGSEREAARRAQVAEGLTFAAVSESYLQAKQEALRSSSYAQAKRYFALHWKPFHDKPLGSISRAQVALRLRELIDKHGRIAAARARSNLSALFAWAIREGLVDANPVVATNNPENGVRSRERVLSDTELATLWRCCSDDDGGTIVKLLILSGCRRDEIGKLKFSEIDLETGLLRIPGERTKNHRTLELTLPPLALDLLRAVKRQGRPGPYVFGRGDGFRAWSWATIVLRMRMQARGQASNFVLHDLRRSMRTGLGRLGIAPHVAELCLGHAKGGLQATYDRFSYQPQIAAALAAWADHVQSIVEGRPANVVPMIQAK
jgi:integrase